MYGAVCLPGCLAGCVCVSGWLAGYFYSFIPCRREDGWMWVDRRLKGMICTLVLPLVLVLMR